jgi:two-component system sensor histidine kinase DesK
MTGAPARPSGDGQPQAGPLTPSFWPAAGDPAAWRRRRYGWILMVIWLVYLGQPTAAVWHNPDLVRRYVGLAILFAFGAVFVTTFALLRRRPGWHLPLMARVSLTAVSAGLVTSALVTFGEDAGGMLVYLAVMMVFLFPARVGWTMVAVILAASLVVPRLIHGWQASPTFTFGVFVAALAAWGVAQLIQRNTQLDAARQEIVRLVRAEERSRFGRDLHDILGHSLTVVAIKAELAGRLVGTSPERAEAEIADVERIAREALADVRTAAAGYREVTLAGELASARTALTAAGIQPDLPARLTQIPPRQQEIFGWAIREGVTNVVRHSGATYCSVRIAGAEIEITDDGRGGGTCAGLETGGTDELDGGHGLAGLRERAAAVGGSVSVGRSAAGGFALRVRVP